MSTFTWSTLLFNPLHHDKGQATTGRHAAAEALFAPKEEPPSREPESAVVHKPRILAAQPPARSDAAGTGVSPSQKPRRAIPKSAVDRIRTWLRYGMTVRQAADACGVSVSELKDTLRLRGAR
jgi:hypothetical protein